MAWVVNSLPQPSCPLEGQLGRALVQAGFWFRVRWAVKAWLVCEGRLAGSSELVPPLWLHLQGQAVFPLPLLGEAVMALGP